MNKSNDSNQPIEWNRSMFFFYTLHGPWTGFEFLFVEQIWFLHWNWIFDKQIEKKLVWLCQIKICFRFLDGFVVFASSLVLLIYLLLFFLSPSNSHANLANSTESITKTITKTINPHRPMIAIAIGWNVYIHCPVKTRFIDYRSFCWHRARHCNLQFQSFARLIFSFSSCTRNRI